MVLQEPGSSLLLGDVTRPEPTDGHVLMPVAACAVCRTDLHLLDGELPAPKLPLVPGHQIVGRVEETKDAKFKVRDRVGIPWLGWSDGDCVYCRSARENLCDRAKFTGYTIDGGYAEYVAADARFLGPADLMKRRRRNSMRRLFSRRLDHSCRKRSAIWQKAASSSLAEST